jgi:hypothetical protein
MEIKKEAICGTLESNDLLVKVAPRNGLEVVISSEVMRQFGARIREVVGETLKQMDVSLRTRALWTAPFVPGFKPLYCADVILKNWTGGACDEKTAS